MVGVIFDSNALITCNKPPPVSDAIVEINKLLYSGIVQRVTVYLTLDILKEYETVVAPRAGKCNEYPELVGSINRLLELRRIVQKSHGLYASRGGRVQSFTSSRVLWWRDTR